MKFTDGQWTLKKGVNACIPAHVYNYQIEGEQVKIFLPVKPAVQRENTIDQGMVTLQISSPTEDILKIRIYHHLTRKKSPDFEIKKGLERLNVTESSDMLQITSGKLTAQISLNGQFELKYLYEGKEITSCKKNGMAYLEDSSTENTYVREQLSIGVGECIYGLGERFTPFAKNGQTVDIWNEDGGTASDIAYKNVPFYISNKGYGVFVNHTENVSFEVGSEQVEAVQFSAEGEYLEYFMIGGGTMKQVLMHYTGLTGRAEVPPAWTFGLWLSTSFTTDYDEKTVTQFVDKMRDYDIPLSVFHFDCFWMKSFQWCDYKWNLDLFPDPAGMLGRLKEKGLKISVWINLYVSQQSELFLEGAEKGYFLHRPDGEVWQWDRWQAGMAIIDFTNPDACIWFQDKLMALMEMGVDCFKTDFGERIPTDVIYYDKSCPYKMHNYYTFLYNKTVHELFAKSGREGVLFARSATAGCQRFPVHWGGDCWGSYESMAASLRGGLSLCLSGFGYWSHDIGGFETSASADLYKRWIAFGLLSTHSRLHGSHSYRVPWNYDEEACDVLRFFTKLKCSLMPYIYGQSKVYADSGIPVMRPMVLEFEKDPSCKNLDLQYMLGENILVAPVFNSDGNALYYLPKGTWTDFITGQVQEGGSYIAEHCSYLKIPMMIRENSIIPIGNTDTAPDYNYAEGITFFVYQMKEEKTAYSSVYDTKGNLCIQLEVTKCGQIYKFVLKGAAGSVKIMLINVKDSVQKSMMAYESTERGTCIYIEEIRDMEFEIEFS